MPAEQLTAFAEPVLSAKPPQDIVSNGLTSDEATCRLEKDGPNATPDTSAHPLRNALVKLNVLCTTEWSVGLSG
jgi:Cation transporter/ATPase, N-terminus